VSISFLAKRRAVSHKPFQSPRWKRLALEMICLTLPRRVDGQSKAGRNCATQSKMCAAKESRGYLSARSSTRCIHPANCSIASPLGVTLPIRKSRSSKRRSVLSILYCTCIPHGCLLWNDEAKANIKPIHECRCNGRLQTKRSTRLSHTGLVVCDGRVACIFTPARQKPLNKKKCILQVSKSLFCDLPIQFRERFH
jgi:hypothetical protein